MNHQKAYGLTGSSSFTSEKERSCFFLRICLEIGNEILQSPSALSDFCYMDFSANLPLLLQLVRGLTLNIYCYFGEKARLAFRF